MIEKCNVNNRLRVFARLNKEIMNATSQRTPLFNEVISETGKSFKNGIIVFDLVERNVIYANEMVDTLLGPLTFFSIENNDYLLLHIKSEHMPTYWKLHPISK